MIPWMSSGSKKGGSRKQDATKLVVVDHEDEERSRCDRSFLLPY